MIHARRTQVMLEQYRPIVFNTKTPHSMPVFLIDGGRRHVAVRWTPGAVETVRAVAAVSVAGGRRRGEGARRLPRQCFLIRTS